MKVKENKKTHKDLKTKAALAAGLALLTILSPLKSLAEGQGEESYSAMVEENTNPQQYIKDKPKKPTSTAQGRRPRPKKPRKKTLAKKPNSSKKRSSSTIEVGLDPIPAQACHKPENPSLEDLKWDYDEVPQEHINSIAQRLKVVHKILVEGGRAYDYRIHTLPELRQILAKVRSSN